MRTAARLFLSTLIFALTAAQSAADVTVAEQKFERRRVLTVQNPYPCPVTVTLTRATLQNMTCTVPVPHTIEVPAGGTQRLCGFVAADPAKAWKYDYKWERRCGSAAARPDGTIYQLPYAKGRAFRVVQGPGGAFSHSGEFAHAVDWTMPVGTEVRAAREGIVADVKSEFTEGGPNRSLTAKANYITILHGDGTLGEYVHLQQNGALVKIGQQVKAGQVIGLSGNTGFTSGPHLHFHVCVPVDGTKIRTFPVKFRTGPGAPATLQTGDNFTAP